MLVKFDGAGTSRFYEKDGIVYLAKKRRQCHKVDCIFSQTSQYISRYRECTTSACITIFYLEFESSKKRQTKQEFLTIINGRKDIRPEDYYLIRDIVKQLTRNGDCRFDKVMTNFFKISINSIEKSFSKR